MAKPLDDILAPIFCVWCGQNIPSSRRGHGSPPKTCSEKCRRLRASALEKTRYQKVKDTERWKEVRANYIERIKERLADDPEYAALFRAYANAQTQKWRVTRDLDPDKRAATLKAQRAERAAWRKRLLDTEMAWESHKFKARQWYRTLSSENRARIYGIKPR